MTGVRKRVAGAALAIGCATVALGPIAVSADLFSSDSQASADYCVAVYRYIGAGFSATLPFGDDKTTNQYLLIYSPAFVSATQDLAKGSPPALSNFFERQSRIFEHGVELLRGVGVSDERVDELARGTLEITTTSEGIDRRLAHQLGVGKNELVRAAEKFRRIADGVARTEVPKRLRPDYARSAKPCVLRPQKIACPELLTMHEAVDLLGGTSRPGRASDTCIYQHGSSELTVMVLKGGDSAFQIFRSSAIPGALAGLGDEAVAYVDPQRAGVGTVQVRKGDRIVLIELRKAHGLSLDALIGLARKIVERLG